MSDNNQVEPKASWAMETYSVSLHNTVVSMQAVYLEAQYGKGAHAAIDLLETFLEGPGNIPDEPLAPFVDPMAFYQKHQAHYSDSPEIKTACFCGKPATMVLHSSKGYFSYCSREHMRQQEHGYHLQPKPGKIVIPANYLQALLQFLIEHDEPFNRTIYSYVIVQIDVDNNFIFTATDRHGLAQYQPGPFKPEAIVENILLSGQMLQFILQNCDFNSFTLNRTHANNWQFAHDDYLIQFQSAEYHVPAPIPTYISEKMENAESPGLSNYQIGYLMKIKVASELLEAIPHISLHNALPTSKDGAVPAVAIVKFFGAPFFKVAVMPLADKPLESQLKH